MKTAMQELIELMESHHKRGWSYMTFDFFFNELKEHTFLEKEKEQIINAHFEGWSDAYNYLKDDFSPPRQASDYYEETYNQNK